MNESNPAPTPAPDPNAPRPTPAPGPAPGTSTAQSSDPGPLRFGGMSPKQYWRWNIICVLALLVVWFLVSYGCGILWADALDKHRTPGGGVKLGFWWAQQGSIYVFVLLIGIYVLFMNRLDAKYRGKKR